MITVLFQSESHYPVNRKKLKEAIIAVLEKSVNRSAEVGISIVGDRRMRALNKKYRNLDKTTDVLSFPLYDEKGKDTSFVAHPDDILRLGDIVISYPQAIKEATVQVRLVDDVINDLAIHGLHHLLGIHHPE